MLIQKRIGELFNFFFDRLIRKQAKRKEHARNLNEKHGLFYLLLFFCKHINLDR